MPKFLDRHGRYHKCENRACKRDANLFDNGWFCVQCHYWRKRLNIPPGSSTQDTSPDVKMSFHFTHNIIPEKKTKC